MTTLYIVGNGFDMHHRLPTSYSGFKEFAKYSSFTNAFERYFAFAPSDGSFDDIWADLETNLSKFSVDELIEDKSNYYDDDPHEDQFNYEVDAEIVNLTQGLIESLSAYLALADKHPIEPCTFLNLDHECRFINFNYTHTLERIYQIPAANICHIHGMLNSDIAPMVIGHGLERSKYEAPKKIDISHYTDEQVSEFCDVYSAKYDDAVESAHRYYNLSIKDTQDCIALHNDFLNSLQDVEKIIVLGHSLSDIDYPYFEWLNSMVKSDCLWQASFYPVNQKEKIWNNLEEIVNDVSRMELFEMSALTLTG
jgi:hypothetical protein